MGEETGPQALIMVYTGSGKGKTSAAVGQAVRALGGGMKVAFGQFLKRDNQAGEQLALRSMLEKDFFASGIGFFRGKKNELQRHRQGALRLIEWAREKIREKYFLLVLDEALYALKMKIISRDELEMILDEASSAGTSIVLTGREPPPWLIEKADMVSEILEVKHHFHKNIPAGKGIEY